MVVKPSIGVVLNAYKRTEFLELQLNALENQSIPPSKIYVWRNKGDDIPKHLLGRFTLCDCSENLGVWSRFAFALNLDTDFICLFDDDTIPGKDWFKNCLETMPKVNGLLGTRGLQYLSSRKYEPYKDFGWKEPNEETVKVDIVGHSWFFKREHIALFWSELPPIHASKTAGEDIHFSYMLQKNGIGTYVPPHPKNNLDLWGSLPQYGKELGNNDAAISQGLNANTKFDLAYQYYISKGFNLTLNLQERMSSGIVIGTDVKRNPFLTKLVNKSVILKKTAKYIVLTLKKINIHI